MSIPQMIFASTPGIFFQHFMVCELCIYWIATWHKIIVGMTWLGNWWHLLNKHIWSIICQQYLQSSGMMVCRTATCLYYFHILHYYCSIKQGNNTGRCWLMYVGIARIGLCTFHQIAAYHLCSVLYMELVHHNQQMGWHCNFACYEKGEIDVEWYCDDVPVSTFAVTAVKPLMSDHPKCSKQWS